MSDLFVQIVQRSCPLQVNLGWEMIPVPVPNIPMSRNGWDYCVPREIRTWLKEHVGKEMHYSSKWGWKGNWRVSEANGKPCFMFASKSHATLFKLTWGGA